MANEPKAAKIDVCGWAITLSAKAKTAGMTIAARAALFSAGTFTGGDHTSVLRASIDHAPVDRYEGAPSAEVASCPWPAAIARRT